MAKILRLSDRIKIKVEDVTFWIAPIGAVVKKEIAGCTKLQGGKEVFDLFDAQMIYLKHGLKKVEGITTYKDEPYELEFINDQLTDECVSEILSIDCTPKFLESAWNVFNGFTGQQVEGAEIEIEPGK